MKNIEPSDALCPGLYQWDLNPAKKFFPHPSVWDTVERDSEYMKLIDFSEHIDDHTKALLKDWEPYGLKSWFLIWVVSFIVPHPAEHRRDDRGFYLGLKREASTLRKALAASKLIFELGHPRVGPKDGPFGAYRLYDEMSSFLDKIDKQVSDRKTQFSKKGPSEPLNRQIALAVLADFANYFKVPLALVFRTVAIAQIPDREPSSSDLERVRSSIKRALKKFPMRLTPPARPS